MKCFLQSILILLSIAVFSKLHSSEIIPVGSPVSTATVELRLPAGEQALFNYWDENNLIQRLEFKNGSKGDSVIVQTITLSKPTHLTRGVFFRSAATKKLVGHSDNYLLLPGDTLKLQLANNVLKTNYYSGGALQLDELFWIPSTFDNEFELYKQYKATGISAGFDPFTNNTLQRINDSTRSALARIEVLYKRGKLKPDYYRALQTAAHLIASNNIVIYSTIYPVINRAYVEVFQSIEAWDGIASRMNNSVLDYIFTQRAMNGDTKDGRWGSFMTLSSKFKIKPLINNYLLYKISTDEVVKNVDSLSYHIAVLSEAGFDKSRLVSYFEQRNRESKLAASTDGTLISQRNDTVNLRKALALFKGKFVFVDIWASWCTPCFGQMPYLKKVAAELKDEKIVFLAISADKDDQHEAWMAASKREGLNNEELNFRFYKGFRNDYLETNKIISIPRYLLFDPQGEIVVVDFVQPSDPEFRKRLLAYLRKK